MLGKKLLGASAKGGSLDVEDVFAAYPYPGTGANSSIVNGLDMAGEGGLTWFKSRSSANYPVWYDTERPLGYALSPGLADGQFSQAGYFLSFNSDGVSMGGQSDVNASSTNYINYSFRKAPKFFDIVTYAGNGTSQAIPHSLGSVPGMIIVKAINSAQSWGVYHKALGAAQYLQFNATAASASSSLLWNGMQPTASTFTVGGSSWTNLAGLNYIAYIFAHDAGGFGDTGSESIIKCGSYIGNGSANGPFIDLGWEPQYVLIKRTDATADWYMMDRSRGLGFATSQQFIQSAFLNATETAVSSYILPSANGFSVGITSNFLNASGGGYVYLAIRNGPVSPPKTGAEVFKTEAGSVTPPSPPAWRGPRPDWSWYRIMNTTGGYVSSFRYSQGESKFINSGNTAVTAANYRFDYWNGFYNASSLSAYNGWMFKQAPGFMDIQRYLGDATSNRAIPHGLKAVPEMLIGIDWHNSNNAGVYHKALTPGYSLLWFSGNGHLGEANSSSFWGSSSHTDTNVYVGSALNALSVEYYLLAFASLPGVSKVGSYVGNGGSSDINIDCGFTNGARFVLIKPFTTTGTWYQFDTNMGITSGSTTTLQMTNTATPVSSINFIRPYAPGFTVNAGASTTLNINGVGFIYLAIS